ncbi:DUF6065 family protein [Xanthomonas arboricola]|uniref:DUF6065 family protein n=1 Tax=Xanthomonas arboricola TaxID=56448 RepID=UPI0006CAE338|nr:DUF6065 family protein [Xanthomonas arboricola]KPN07990.1 hypothetical protein AN651_06500 [Xanthomonas arboricola]NIK42769.1 hypothetical protein [Xanthomonas arboricola]
MKLTAHVLDGHTLDIRPAPHERDWMDATDQRYAYRCLPLAIANAHGWELLCQAGFEASWDGRDGLDAIRISVDAGAASPAISHFGYGVLTFHVPCLFRTDAGMDLFVTGPLNRPKDGIGALSGMVETDWSPYTFTMNWKFTRPGQVRFEAGEPFCHLFPLPRQLIEQVQPQWKPLSEAPQLAQQHAEWTRSRTQFLQELPDAQSAAAREKWQRGYFRGVAGADQAPVQGHRSRLRLPMFVRADSNGDGPLD